MPYSIIFKYQPVTCEIPKINKYLTQKPLFSKEKYWILRVLKSMYFNMFRVALIQNRLLYYFLLINRIIDERRARRDLECFYQTRFY